MVAATARPRPEDLRPGIVRRALARLLPKTSAQTLPGGLVRLGQGRLQEPSDGPRPLPRGGAGTQIAAGVIDDVDQNLDVRGDKWYGRPGLIGISSKMMRDGHVRQSLTSRIAPVVGAVWDMSPASESALDLEKADYAAHAFFELLRWRKLVREASLYHKDGFSIFEATTDSVPISRERFPLHPGAGRGIVYTGFHHRPAWTIYRWLQSERDPTTLDGVEQFIVGSDGEEAGFRTIPGNWLLRFTQEQEGANFAGFSTLRSAYGPWKIKIMLLVLDAIRHERQGIGFPRITLPEHDVSDQEIARAEVILSELRAQEKGYLILDHGFEFKWENVDSQSTAIGEAIERCDRDIAFNTGSGFQLLGLTGVKGGSNALSQTQLGQHQLQVEHDALFFADTMNFGSDGFEPIKRLIDQNYGPGGPCPTLVPLNLPTRDWSAIFPVVNEMLRTGGIVGDDRLEAFARRVMYLPRIERQTRRIVLMPGLPATPPGLIPPSVPAPGSQPAPNNGGPVTAPKAPTKTPATTPEEPA